MAQRGPRHRDRKVDQSGNARTQRIRRVVKPVDWPRYMIAKRLSSGTVAYYWNARKADIAAGFALHREALGLDYGSAIARAGLLNRHLDDWRKDRGGERSLDASPRYGSVDWWLETYMRSPAFLKLQERTKPQYRYQLKLLADLITKPGGRLGELPVKSITPAAVDKIYDKLRKGGSGQRLRTANHTIDIAKRAWTVVQRTHPKLFQSSNPFVGLTRFHSTAVVKHATRAEAYALSSAICDFGHSHLAVVPLVCFKWLQRPENVLAGHLRWTDYRPDERPDCVRIVHHKTGEIIWHPLSAAGQQFYPDLEIYLATLNRVAIPIVVSPGRKGPPRPYSFSYAKWIVREARRAAGLPEHVTLTACRHDGTR